MQPAMKLGAWPVLAFVLEPHHPQRGSVDPPLMRIHSYENHMIIEVTYFVMRFRMAVLDA
jgi:hypothetical protein